jgi:O-antigen ligase
MADLLTPTMILILIVATAIALLLGVRLAKNPSLGVILMAFFLPFERIPSLDFAGFTFKINHLVGGLTLLFWLLAILLNRRKIVPNPIGIPLLLLFFFYFLSGLGAENQFRQWTVFVSMAIMLGIYLAAVNGITSERIVKTVVSAIFLSAGLMAVIGIYQFFADLAGLPVELTGLDPGYTKVVFGFPRVHAFSKEPLYFANYLFIPLGLSLALFLAKGKTAATTAKQTSQHWIERTADRLTGPWLLPFLVLLLIVFFLTLSRGAFISAVPFAVIFIFLYARNILTVRNVVLGGLVLLISVSTVVGILNSVSPDALERFLGHAQLQDVLVQKTGESGFGRLNAFGQAIEAWQSKPIFGVGLGNFGPYIKGYPVNTPATGWDIVNNEYLEILAETGIAGLLTTLLMLGIIAIRSIAAYRRTKDSYMKAVLVGLTAAYVAMFTQYNFFSTFYIIHIWVLFGLLVGVQNVVLTPERLPKD